MLYFRSCLQNVDSQYPCWYKTSKMTSKTTLFASWDQWPGINSTILFLKYNFDMFKLFPTEFVFYQRFFYAFIFYEDEVGAITKIRKYASPERNNHQNTFWLHKHVWSLLYILLSKKNAGKQKYSSNQHEIFNMMNC